MKNQTSEGEHHLLSCVSRSIFSRRTKQMVCGLVVSLMAGRLRAATRPNVVIIMPDDLSYNDYSYYNHQPDAPRTPNMDRLGRESVRLTDFHVAPTCSPSRAQLMTGRYDDACGVWHTVMGRYFLRTNEVTMADVFKANSYRTAIFGKWHLGEIYPFRPEDRGFEHVVIIHGGGIDQEPDVWGNRNTVPCTLFNDGRPVVLTNANGGLPGFQEGPGKYHGRIGIPLAFSTNYFTTQAIDYMRSCQAKREPFFAYIPYNVVHKPSDMPPDARPGIDAHTATIENMDKNVGRILRFLDASGLRKNTILIVILGDNGMASPMFRGGKASEYEGGHRVPCFIRWPSGGWAGTPATAREMPRLTSEMDLLPTLMDVLNLHDVAHRSPQVPIEGLSLKTLLDSNPKDYDPAFGTRVLVVDNQRLDDLVKYKQACVMRDELDSRGNIVHKWRLIRPSASQPWELYDIQADRLEKHNLLLQPQSAHIKKIVSSLRAAYEAWWLGVSAHASEYSRPIAGSMAEPTICLYSHDWHMASGLPPWNQTMVAAGMKANGFNAVAFKRAGDYSFDLHRWPRQIANETTIDSGLLVPIRITQSNALTYGKPLPIRSARIRIWNGNKTYADETKPVDPSSDGPDFIVRLPAGPAMVQTWFYDASGHVLCGAYYDYVTRLNGTGE